MNSIIVKAEWDNEAQVWVATSDDVRGLVAESASLEMLRPKILAMIADLVEENGIDTDLVEIPVHIIAQSTERMKLVPAA